jgi:hypothetical protein
MKGRDWIVPVLCAALFIVLILPLRGSIVDDTYIHLQYARNVSTHGELSFNRGDPTYGATSPLWVFMLALCHRAGLDIATWCRILAWLFGIASIVLVYACMISLSGRRSYAGAAALITASDAWLLRWSAVGMETSFAVFMILCALFLCCRRIDSARWSALFGLVLFGATLSRPEAVLLVPLALAAFVISRMRGMRVSFIWLAVFVPLFAVWLFLVKDHTGTYFPLTAGAKQGRVLLSTAILRRALVPAMIIGATALAPALALVAGIAAGIFRDRSLCSYLEVTSGQDSGGARRCNTGVLLMLLWIFALPVAYAVFDFQVLSRYILPVIPAIVILGILAGGRLLERFVSVSSRRKVILAIVTVLAVVQSVVFYYRVVVPPTRAFTRGMNEVLVPMGEWLRMNTPPEALVAAPDIGAVGYVSEREILDLGGLVTPEINRMRQTIDVERIIDEGRYLEFGPGFLVDRHEEPDRFTGKIIGGYRFDPVMSGTVSNLGIRKPEPVVYVLYRLTSTAD